MSVMELFVRPAGPADAEEIAAVQRISWQATYAEMLSAASLARVESAWDPAHWQRTLERVDDRMATLVLEGRGVGVVGFGMAGPRRGSRDPLLTGFAAEIYMLYLLPAVQRRGNGARLMGGLARVLKARGMSSALVWALAANEAAVSFYLHLAGTVLMQARKPFFGETVTEVALGWRDIDRLTNLSWSQRD